MIGRSSTYGATLDELTKINTGLIVSMMWRTHCASRWSRKKLTLSGFAREQPTQATSENEARVQRCNVSIVAHGADGLDMDFVARIVDQASEVDIEAPGKILKNVEGSDLLAFVRRVWQTRR